MRHTLLGSVAAAALALGMSHALAQNADKGEGRGMQKGAPAAEHAAPRAEPSMEHRSAAETPKADVAKPEKAAEAPKPAETPAPKAAESAKPTEHQAQQKASEPKAESRKAATEVDRRPGTTPDAAKADAKTPGRNAERSNSSRGSNTGRSATSDRDNDPKKAGIDARQADAKTDVTIDSQKQTKIQEVIHEQRVENITRPDFSISVGTVVPARYHYHRLPEEIVTIVPEYRGYDYIVAENEIVILDPHTHKIVYTMQEGRSAAMDHRSVDCR